MTVKHLPSTVNTVIVGNGPSALILSYILHGHVPYYNKANPHPDPILHEKLSQSPCLLDLDINLDDLTAHFGASRLSYSTQALPVNVLLDTLLRPMVDTQAHKYDSCIQWRYQERNKIEHIVVGSAGHTGGQWAENPVSASWDISALSYAEMLSLPGYSFETHYAQTNGGKSLPGFSRPTRRDVAAYYSTYPKAVGIRDSIYTGVKLDGISSAGHGYHIASHDIFCQNLVLASGVFTNLVPPRPLLQPLKHLSLTPSEPDAPLLVIGSGFTAADVIISTPADRKIIHLYKWDPETRPSPLRACHRSAYPEYASVYRRMKLAAAQSHNTNVISTSLRKNDLSSERDSNYEGLPNTFVADVQIHDGCAILQLQTHDNRMITRTISNFEYVIGRRGSLDFLDENIRGSLLGSMDEGLVIKGQSLRPKIEHDNELLPHLYATGSLTGDSLVRFAYGGCVLVARKILGHTLKPIPILSNESSNFSEVNRIIPEHEARFGEIERTLSSELEPVYG